MAESTSWGFIISLPNWYRWFKEFSSFTLRWLIRWSVILKKWKTIFWSAFSVEICYFAFFIIELFLAAYDHVNRLSHATTVASSYDQVRHQLVESLITLGGHLSMLEKGEISKTGSINPPLPTHVFSGLTSQMAKISANIIESVCINLHFCHISNFSDFSSFWFRTFLVIFY